MCSSVARPPRKSSEKKVSSRFFGGRDVATDIRAGIFGDAAHIPYFHGHDGRKGLLVLNLLLQRGLWLSRSQRIHAARRRRVAAAEAAMVRYCETRQFNVVLPCCATTREDPVIRGMAEHRGGARCGRPCWRATPGTGPPPGLPILKLSKSRTSCILVLAARGRPRGGNRGCDKPGIGRGGATGPDRCRGRRRRVPAAAPAGPAESVRHGRGRFL